MNRKISVLKKGEIQFWMVMLILGLIFFLIVVIVQTDVVKKFLKPVGEKENETVSRLDCMVPFGSSRDTDGDGIDDTKEGCDIYARSD